MDLAAVTTARMLAGLVGSIRELRETDPWDADRLWEVLSGYEILGIGVVAGDDGRGLGPTIFVLGNDPWSTLTEFDFPWSWSHNWLGSEKKHLVTVISMPRAEAMANVGDCCDSPTASGTLGARVTASSGADAVLISGHAADSKGEAINDDTGSRLGAVGYCIHPCSTQHAPKPQEAVLDVAVLELDRGVDIGGPVHATTPAVVLPRHDVDVYGAVTTPRPVSTWVRGFSSFWMGPDPACGDWADVWVTGDSVSKYGDSGALTTRAGTLEPVGHIVGGAPGAYSLIQDLRSQLAGCGGLLLR